MEEIRISPSMIHRDIDPSFTPRGRLLYLNSSILSRWRIHLPCLPIGDISPSTKEDSHTDSISLINEH